MDVPGSRLQIEVHRLGAEVKLSQEESHPDAGSRVEPMAGFAADAVVVPVESKVDAVKPESREGLPMTHEEGVRAMADWNTTKREPPFDELMAAYLACWPAMHVYGYHHGNIPGGKVIAEAMTGRRIARLVLYLREHHEAHLLFISLDLPLKLTNGARGGIAAFFAFYKLWHKFRILGCFEARQDDPSRDWDVHSLGNYIERPLVPEFQGMEYNNG